MIISELKHYQCWKHRGKSSAESSIQSRGVTDRFRGLLLSQVAGKSGHCIGQRTHWELVWPPGDGCIKLQGHSVLWKHCQTPSHPVETLPPRNVGSLTAGESLDIVKNPSFFSLSWLLTVGSPNLLTADHISLTLKVKFKGNCQKSTSWIFWEPFKANAVLNARLQIWRPLLSCFCFPLIVQHHLFLICWQMS